MIGSAMVIAYRAKSWVKMHMKRHKSLLTSCFLEAQTAIQTCKCNQNAKISLRDFVNDDWCKLKLLLVNYYVVCGAKDLQGARKRARRSSGEWTSARVSTSTYAKNKTATCCAARLDTQFTICQDQDTTTIKAPATSTRSMLYKPHTPMELGDAVLGQLTSVLVFMFDHMIPAVHNVVSWETDDIDLGPIIPEWSGDARPASDKSKSFTPQPRALSA